jgi:hypothetical protein
MDDLNLEDDPDALVRQWAKSTSLSTPDLVRLSDDICAAAQQPAAHSPAPQLRARSSSAASIGVLAASAALLVACVGYVLQRNVPAQVPANGVAANGALGSDAQLAQTAALSSEHLQAVAGEFARLFHHRVAWLAETNQQVMVGVEDDAHADDQQKSQITLRVVVFHRADSSRMWQPVYSTNIITREEEVVEFKGLDNQSRMRLWTHVLPDQAVAVASDLSLGDGATATHWSTTSVLSNTGAVAILREQHASGEYQVWQSAAVVSEKAL